MGEMADAQIDHMMDKALGLDSHEPRFGTHTGVDPLRMHTPVRFLRAVRETKKACLFEFTGKDGYPVEAWVPKALIRELNPKKCSMYVFKPFWADKRKEHNISIGSGRGNTKPKKRPEVVNKRAFDAAADEVLGIFEPADMKLPARGKLDGS